MQGIWSLSALLVVAQAARPCNTTLWIADAGDTVHTAMDVLGIDRQVLKDYNGELSDIDTISVTQTFSVLYKCSLPSDAWLTERGTCFLQLHATSPEKASGESTITNRPSYACNPVSTPQDHSTSVLTAKTQKNKPIYTSPVSGDKATRKGPDAVTRTTTLQIDSSRPTEAVSKVCGLTKALPLQCQDKNDGLFFTDETALRIRAQSFCADRSEKLVTNEDGPQVLPYKGDHGNEYLFQIYSFQTAFQKQSRTYAKQTNVFVYSGMPRRAASPMVEREGVFWIPAYVWNTITLPSVVHTFQHMI